MWRYRQRRGDESNLHGLRRNVNKKNLLAFEMMRFILDVVFYLYSVHINVFCLIGQSLQANQ